jgi:hypothetical protein
MELVEEILEDLIADEVEDADEFEVFIVEDLITEDNRGRVGRRLCAVVVDSLYQRGTFQGIVNMLMMILSLIMFSRIRYTSMRCSVGGFR